VKEMSEDEEEKTRRALYEKHCTEMCLKGFIECCSYNYDEDEQAHPPTPRKKRGNRNK